MKKVCLLLLVTTVAICGFTQTKKNAGLFAGKASKPKLINPEGKTPFPYAHFVNKGFEDKSGILWFGSSEGVYRYDGNLFTLFEEMDGTDVRSKMNSLTNITQDRIGNVWFGAVGAAIRFNGKAFESIKMPSNSIAGYFGISESGNSKRNLWDETPEVKVFPDIAGNVWFFSGCNVFRHNEKTGLAEHTGLGYYMKNVIAPYDSVRRDYTIHTVYQDRIGGLWFTASGCQTAKNEAYRLFGGWAGNKCILNQCNQDLKQASDVVAHNKHIASNFSKLSLWETHNTFSFTCCMEDRDGNMWFGTDRDGVYRYDVKGVSLDPSTAHTRNDHYFITRFTLNDQLSKSYIEKIHQDQSGRIWFGTGPQSNFQGDGVFCYNPNSPQKNGTPVVKHYTTADGLCSKSPFSNNVIMSFADDNSGKVWFGGDGGLSYFDGKKFVSLLKKDGLTDDHVGFIIKDNKGRIWLGTWNLGLYSFDGKTMKCFTESNS